MQQALLSWITSFIWGIADNVLRDLYVRGKYRDVILPMTVIRRLDVVLEPTSKAVLDMKALLDRQGIFRQDAPLRLAAGQAFYNTSKFTLRDLRFFENLRRAVRQRYAEAVDYQEYDRRMNALVAAAHLVTPRITPTITADDQSLSYAWLRECDLLNYYERGVP